VVGALIAVVVSLLVFHTISDKIYIAMSIGFLVAPVVTNRLWPNRS
jgi:hypothetical protein